MNRLVRNEGDILDDDEFDKLVEIYNMRSPKKYSNIGIRIEDNILIDASGPKNLSANIPKDIKDMER